MALQGHLCEVKAQSSAVAMTDEATTTSDNISYQITDSAKRIMDINTTVVVGGAGSDRYRVDYINGTIIFHESGTRTITVTGAYVVPTTVATADSFSFNGSADALEFTQFQDTAKQFQAGLTSGTATLGRFFVTDDLFRQAILDKEIKVLEYHVDASNSIKFYGLITSASPDAPVADLIKETMNFQITNGVGVF